MHLHAPIPILLIFDEAEAKERFGDGCPGASVHVQVTGLEEFIRSLVEKDYKYSKPGIEETSWGHWETAIKDPFGNKIVFFEPMATQEKVNSVESP